MRPPVEENPTECSCAAVAGQAEQQLPIADPAVDTIGRGQAEYRNKVCGGREAAGAAENWQLPGLEPRPCGCD